MTKRALWWRGAGVALALIGGLAAPPVQAAGGRACRAALIGTYLVTINDAKGAFASRAIVTFHGDGTLSVVDSRQDQGVQRSSFSAQQGAYRCTGRHRAVGRTLDFSFPANTSIARLDWRVRRAGTRGSIAGTITLVIYAGVKGVDPFGPGGKHAGRFRFTAVRVVAPAR